MTTPLMCPFCASENVDAAGWLDGNGHRGPECLGCGATAPSIEVWNERRTSMGKLLEHITTLEADVNQLRMLYAGAMGTLSELSGHYALNHRLDREEARERLHATAKDWCAISGWTFRIVGNKLCLDPPPVKQPDIKGGA